MDIDINVLKAKYLNITFFKNNILYILWFLFYFNTTWTLLSWYSYTMAETFFFTIIIYGISIGTALSPIGEYILRFTSNVRILRTKREKEYLLPLFQDVYAEAKKIYPGLTNNIDICIMDAMYINAFAMGRKTVAVTRGAVDSLSEEELKALIAHELGHIANGDTKAVLLTTIGNGIFSIFIIVLQKIINIFDTLFYGMGLIWGIIVIIKLIFNVFLLYFVYIAQFILSINSRQNEYKADKFAFEVGFGDDLVGALYLLQRMCISDRSKLANKLIVSHPHIAKRIEKIEILIDKAEQE